MAQQSKDSGVIMKEQRVLSKAQQKRLDQYKSLGTKSKARNDKQKFDARYASLYQKSFSRRRKLTKLSMYEQFVEILSIRSSKTLNPSNFLDYLASIITVYVGKNQTVSISKWTTNRHINTELPLTITNIDQLIPYYAPRDKVSFKIPAKFQKKQTQNTSQETKQEYIDWDGKDNDNDAAQSQKEKEEEIMRINSNYCFAALPDQRLFADDKCSPYIMDDAFQWTILYGTNCKPPKLQHKRAGFEKIVGAAIIGDGKGNTFCIYGTRDGLFYNKKKNGKPVKLIDEMVDGVFRQNDYLFVLCHGPCLYNVSLIAKDNKLAVNEVFRTKRTYNVYTLFNSFIGGYYDQQHDILILGASNAQIYIFKNGGLLDSTFNDRFMRFRKVKLNMSTNEKLERGNSMYFDMDRNAIVYIGTKTVMTIPMINDEEDGGYRFHENDKKFAKIYNIKWFLKGITFDCNYFMYIYHQKTLVILKRVQSSAHCPYVLKVYTGKSLRFR